MKIEEAVALAPRTTLGVGGAARFYAEARDEDEVREALAWAEDHRAEVFALGGGSNLLVADRGYDGLVLRPRILGVDVVDHGGEVEVTAGAGEAWDEFVARAVASSWAGVECLSGIPGEIGATPIQNVGAYGQEVSETIVRVEAIDRASRERVVFDREAARFGYRDSVFKREARDRFVVTRVVFRFVKNGAPKIAYAELAKELAGKAATLAEVRSTVIALRRKKSMVLDASDPNGKSAGSFFMNPIVLRVDLERVRRAHGKDDVPAFAAEGDKVKLSAGWLIERAGFARGTHDGAVGLSTKHALAIVNRGGATASEIVAFASNVRRGVFDRFGVLLHPEPVLLGFDRGEIEALVGALAG